MTSQFWWYVARAGGVVAWALSTVSVVWGLMLSTRVLGRRVTLPKLHLIERRIAFVVDQHDLKIADCLPRK